MSLSLYMDKELNNNVVGVLTNKCYGIIVSFSVFSASPHSISLPLIFHMPWSLATNSSVLCVFIFIYYFLEIVFFFLICALSKSFINYRELSTTRHHVLLCLIYHWHWIQIMTFNSSKYRRKKSFFWLSSGLQFK